MPLLVHCCMRTHQSIVHRASVPHAAMPYGVSLPVPLYPARRALAKAWPTYPSRVRHRAGRSPSRRARYMSLHSPRAWYLQPPSWAPTHCRLLQHRHHTPQGTAALQPCQGTIGYISCYSSCVCKVSVFFFTLTQHRAESLPVANIYLRFIKILNKEKTNIFGPKIVISY